MEQPFTAVVGVESRSQYLELAQEVADRDRSLGELAVGVLMSEKTGLLGLPNRHGEIYPDFDRLDAIAHAAESLDNLGLPIIIHYNTDNPDRVGDQLIRALAPYPNIKLVQVNGLDLDQLRKLRKLKESKDISIIMQVNAQLLESHTPSELTQAITRFDEEVVSYAWLDGSGGLGKKLDWEKLEPFVKELQGVGIGVGIAGGLNPDNLEEMLPDILDSYTEISWDAQSGVMDTIDRGIQRFDTNKAKNFLVKSMQLRQQIAARDADAA